MALTYVLEEYSDHDIVQFVPDKEVSLTKLVIGDNNFEDYAVANVRNTNVRYLKCGSTLVCISYTTPIAAFYGRHRTLWLDEYYSRTSSRHLSEFLQWLADTIGEPAPQAFRLVRDEIHARTTSDLLNKVRAIDLENNTYELRDGSKHKFNGDEPDDKFDAYLW